MSHVASEVSRLRRVVIQRPGDALSCMLPEHIHPDSPDYLLFDDLVHVPTARAEHDQLARVLSTAAEISYVDDMLRGALDDPEQRRWVLERVAALEGLDGALQRRLAEAETEDLRHALVAGRLNHESLLNPLPNLLFARDLAAMVGPMLVVGSPSKRARRREGILTWSMIRSHPWFKGVPISVLGQSLSEEGGRYPLTIEGGDVLVISDKLVLIGASERTTWSMILNLATELLNHGFDTALVVEMPKQRSSMHLDTVFTLVDRDAAVVFGPILERGGPEDCHLVRLRRGPQDQLVVDDMDDDLLEALAREGHPLTPIFCGDRDPLYERREQWTDGSNFFALAPGVVVGYARNNHTRDALEDQGFRCLHTTDYLKELKQEFNDDFDRLLESGRRYAIHITGSELSRGRGGPRCLTLPVLRD